MSKTTEVPPSYEDDDSTKTVAPEFLTIEYLENILKKYNHDSELKVHWMQVGPCSGAFASTLYRVEVLIENKNDEKVERESVIVKVLMASKLAQEILGKAGYNIHEKEMEMFQRIIPKFRAILENVDRNVFPKEISVDAVEEVLVLEDLKLQNFVMSSTKILDMAHIKISLVKLARFHAASMVLMEHDPEIYKNFDVGMFSRKVLTFCNKFSTNMDALTSEVATWEGYENYARKLENLKESMYERSCQNFDNEPGDMKALIHGDFWTNNMLFKYNDDGSLSDAIIVSL